MVEPAPFDLALIVVAASFFLAGMRIPAWCTTPIALLIIFLACGAVGAMQTPALAGSLRHVVITAYLSVATLFFGCFVYRDPERAIKVILSGYAAAAIIAVLAGIIGYFGIVDGASEIFTERSRARGTFKDPNVFGPFLILPALYAFYRLVEGAGKTTGWWILVILLTTFGILLSFSRGAWGHYVFSFALCAFLLLFCGSTRKTRSRVLGSMAVLAVLIGITLAGAISLDPVSAILSERFQLIQDYDIGGGYSRFDGQAFALKQALQHPLGLGAARFAELWQNTAPHNVYLYSFVIGGWVGGLAYLLLILLTAVIGLTALIQPSPLRGPAIVLVSTFLGLIVLGLVIDTDHWRHLYLLIGMIWGLAGHIIQTYGRAKASRIRGAAAYSRPR